MGEQKNLFLAIGLSIAIIIIFQLMFPQQPLVSNPVKNNQEEIQPLNTIDDDVLSSEQIKSKEDSK